MFAYTVGATKAIGLINLIKHIYFRLFHSERVVRQYVDVPYGDVYNYNFISIGYGYFVRVKEKKLRILWSDEYPEMVGKDYDLNENYPHEIKKIAVKEIEGTGAYIMMPKEQVKITFKY